MANRVAGIVTGTALLFVLCGAAISCSSSSKQEQPTAAPRPSPTRAATGCDSFQKDFVIIPNEDVPLGNVSYEKVISLETKSPAWLVTSNEPPDPERQSWVLFDGVTVLASDVHLAHAHSLGSLVRCLGYSYSSLFDHRSISIQPQPTPVQRYITMLGEIVPLPLGAWVSRQMPIVETLPGTIPGPVPYNYSIQRGDSHISLHAVRILQIEISEEDETDFAPLVSAIERLDPADLPAVTEELDKIAAEPAPPELPLLDDISPSRVYVDGQLFEIPPAWQVQFDESSLSFVRGESAAIVALEDLSVLRFLSPSDQEIVPLLDAIDAAGVAARSGGAGKATGATPNH